MTFGRYSVEYKPIIPAGSNAKKQVELAKTAEINAKHSTSPLKTGLRRLSN